MASTQQMKMEMVDRLSAIIPGIDDDAISLVEVMLPGQLSSCSHQVPEQRFMLCNGLRLRCDMFLRDNEQMRRSLRIDIRKAYAELVLINTVRWYLSG